MTNLKKINLPISLKEIGTAGFQECLNLKKINLPSSLKTIGNLAFYNCSSLKNIKIPALIKHIKQGAFENCSNLTKIKIPESVKSIGEYAFAISPKYATIKAKTKHIYIPKSVTKIGKDAFNLNIIYPKSKKANKIKTNIYTPKNSYAYKYAKKNLKHIRIYTPPTKVMLNLKKVSIKKGKTKKIAATIYPLKLPKAFTWKTTNPNVAIYSGGKIKAIGKGMATITVYTINSKKAVCKVKVK